jgi:glutaredoxin 3
MGQSEAPSSPGPWLAEVAVYVTSYCPYCHRARALLDRKAVTYRVVDVEGDDAQREWLRTVTGRHTVPQIFINGQPVGGSDELHALERRGALEPLLRAAPTAPVP